MTIDEAIKVLEQHHMWTGEPQKVAEVRVENSAMGVAIETMHKYQKIAEIVTNNELEWGNTSVRASALWEVKKVVEDGNNN